jgi:hypothetical protein
LIRVSCAAVRLSAAEDMYDPERYGRTAFGELEVTAK